MRGKEALLERQEEWVDLQSGENSQPEEEATHPEAPEGSSQDEPDSLGSGRSGSRAQRRVTRSLVALHQKRTKRYRLKRAVLRFFLGPFGFGKR